MAGIMSILFFFYYKFSSSQIRLVRVNEIIFVVYHMVGISHSGKWLDDRCSVTVNDGASTRPLLTLGHSVSHLMGSGTFSLGSPCIDYTQACSDLISVLWNIFRSFPSVLFRPCECCGWICVENYVTLWFDFVKYLFSYKAPVIAKFHSSIY